MTEKRPPYDTSANNRTLEQLVDTIALLRAALPQPSQGYIPPCPRIDYCLTITAILDRDLPCTDDYLALIGEACRSCNSRPEDQP